MAIFLKFSVFSAHLTLQGCKKTFFPLLHFEWVKMNSNSHSLCVITILMAVFSIQLLFISGVSFLNLKISCFSLKCSIWLQINNLSLERIKCISSRSTGATIVKCLLKSISRDRVRVDIQGEVIQLIRFSSSFHFITNSVTTNTDAF